MIVSFNWLKDYVALDVPAPELEERLMMAGLNHENTTPVGDDLAINVEVTSNRPDCLGHLGVAREAAVLFGRPLNIPKAAPPEGRAAVTELTAVALECPKLCPRYTARVLRGVKVGPSPRWLVDRLATLGIGPINNVVDVTNYVLFECGQPLHAFDLNKLAKRRIVVREARPGEPFVAINHKTYELQAGMCVIADAERPVALGGVMGGADTEVSATTTDILLESAEFDPLSIRNTARRLNLHSDSSYRFERGLDPESTDWASRRACAVILEIAGGELAHGVIDVGRKPAAREPVRLRFAQLARVLGIDVDPRRAREILTALGCRETKADSLMVEVLPPSWRLDLDREIDLVEEVARIHGYDKIPEDVRVPMATSHRTRADRVASRLRSILTAAGFDEAMTLSAVEEPWSEAFSPWTDAPPLRAQTPILRRADLLRRSLVPSLLGARRTNESLFNERIELFEMANVYLAGSRTDKLPTEELMLGMSSGDDFVAVKGVVEAALDALCPGARLEVRPTDQSLLDRARSCELRVSVCETKDVAGSPETAGSAKAAGTTNATRQNERTLGFLGEVSAAGLDQFELRGRTTVAELRVAVLEDLARLVPQYTRPPIYPAVSRDLNLVVDEAVTWAEIERAIRDAAGPEVERIELKDVYRDPKKLAPGKKSLLLSLTLRSPEGTLTGEQADRTCQNIVAACQQKYGAELRA